MRIFGLVGYPLDHSFSSAYFAEKFKAEGITDALYMNFPLEDIAGLPGLVHEKMLDGFNVTIPHKQTVIPYLSELSPEAGAIGAVNCVVRRGSELIGHNTDFHGFRESLLPVIGGERPAALVLGSGGASRAVTAVLEELGMRYRIVSAHPGKNAGYLAYGELDEAVMAAHRLIVNATPVGSYPDTDKAPAIPYGLVTPDHFLIDLVYNPPVSSFLSYGMARGAKTCNGYRMLTLQAEKSWEIFNGRP